MSRSWTETQSERREEDFRLYTAPTTILRYCNTGLVVLVHNHSGNKHQRRTKGSLSPRYYSLECIFFPAVSLDSWINLLWNEHKG